MRSERIQTVQFLLPGGRARSFSSWFAHRKLPSMLFPLEHASDGRKAFRLLARLLAPLLRADSEWMTAAWVGGMTMAGDVLGGSVLRSIGARLLPRPADCSSLPTHEAIYGCGDVNDYRIVPGGPDDRYHGRGCGCGICVLVGKSHSLSCRAGAPPAALSVRISWHR